MIKLLLVSNLRGEMSQQRKEDFFFQSHKWFYTFCRAARIIVDSKLDLIADSRNLLKLFEQPLKN